MKRFLLTSVVVASFAGTAAHAQLPDLTGQVTGTVNQTTRIGAEALDNEAVIDQRTGLALDTRLTGELQRALPRYDRGGSAAPMPSWTPRRAPSRASTARQRARASAHAREPAARQARRR